MLATTCLEMGAFLIVLVVMSLVGIGLANAWDRFRH